jgi:acyl-coenzyme A thioesterase PaaI-like protein
MQTIRSMTVDIESVPNRAIPDGVPPGWTAIASKAFGIHVGPFYRPAEGPKLVCGFLADERHGNKRGVVHGGMLATAFDVALGNACWDAAGQKPCATVQLNVHFIGAVKLGEFAIIRPEVVKTTRSVVFLRGTMTVDDRIVGTADGVWKILEWRGEPFVPS